MSGRDESLGVTIPEFVIQEAKEKCFEIDIKALKQFEKEKKAYLDVEVQKVTEKFEQKTREQEIEYRIRRSAAINKARLAKMEARNRAMMKIFSETQYQIYQRIQTDKAFYSELLRKLLLQGFVQIYEKNVTIRVLEKDVQIVEKVLPQAVKDFQKLLKEQINLDFQCNAHVEKAHFLVERKLKDHSNIKVSDYSEEDGHSDILAKNEDDNKCFGGVILTNTEGNIICKNTLDCRIDLCYQESLPDLRAIMFPRN